MNTATAENALLCAATHGTADVARAGAAPVTVSPTGWICRACRISGTWRGDSASTPVLLAAFVQRHQRCA